MSHGGFNIMLSDRRIGIAWNAIKILFTVVLFGYFLAWVNLSELSSIWVRIKIPYLLATVFLYVVLTLFKAYKYQLLIQQKTKYLRVLNIVIVQNSLSNFLANSAGVASYLALLRLEENVKVRQSGLVFVVTKIGDLFSVWVVSIICSWLLWKRIPLLQDVVIISLTIIGFGFFAFFLALFWRRGFITIANRLLENTRLTKYSLIYNFVHALVAFSELRQDLVFGIVLKAFGLSLLHYLLTLSWMLASMRAFQLPADSLSILFVSCILQLFSMIPVSVFGGLGVTEVTSLYLYSMFGVAQNDLSVVLVGWRIFYFLANLLIVLYLPIYAVFIEWKIASE